MRDETHLHRRAGSFEEHSTFKGRRERFEGKLYAGVHAKYRRIRGKCDVRVSRHWIRPWWKKCLLVSMRREREKKRKSLSKHRWLPLYNVTPKSSRVGFAFSEHWAGCVVPNGEEREREKGASINSRSAGSRRSLFLLRTTNLAPLPNLSSASSQLSTRKRSLVVFPPPPP